MFGDQHRLIAFDEVSEAIEMGLVERLRTADRHAHAVQTHGMVATDGFQRTMRWSPRAHVVLGMNLEEAALLSLGADSAEM